MTANNASTSTNATTNTTATRAAFAGERLNDRLTAEINAIADSGDENALAAFVSDRYRHFDGTDGIAPEQAASIAEDLLAAKGQGAEIAVIAFAEQVAVSADGSTLEGADPSNDGDSSAIYASVYGDRRWSAYYNSYKGSRKVDERCVLSGSKRLSLDKAALGARTCQCCGRTLDKASRLRRVGFAGQSCPSCYEQMKAEHETPGWYN